MKPVQLIGAAPAVSGQLDNRAGRITYWSWTETTGLASAEVRLFDGTGPGGAPLADITLTAGQSTRDIFPTHALPYIGGLFLQVVSGTVNGQVYAVPEDDAEGGAMPVVLVNVDELNLQVGG